MVDVSGVECIATLHTAWKFAGWGIFCEDLNETGPPAGDQLQFFGLTQINLS